MRTFDYDEAAKLRAEGLSYRVVAERLGVSPTAIKRACNPDYRERNNALHAQWQASGSCPDCGAPATRYSRGGQARCRSCYAQTQATSVRATELRCMRCDAWKPDDAFPFNRAANKQRRDRHSFCRECQTEAKREYRERRAFTCSGCGGPRPGLSTRENASGLCRACWVEQRQRKAAA